MTKYNAWGPGAIMFSDLTPDAQKRVLDFLGINSPEELNYDVLPLFELAEPDPQ